MADGDLFPDDIFICLCNGHTPPAKAAGIDYASYGLGHDDLLLESRIVHRYSLLPVIVEKVKAFCALYGYPVKEHNIEVNGAHSCDGGVCLTFKLKRHKPWRPPAPDL